MKKLLKPDMPKRPQMMSETLYENSRKNLEEEKKSIFCVRHDLFVTKRLNSARGDHFPEPDYLSCSLSCVFVSADNTTGRTD